MRRTTMRTHHARILRQVPTPAERLLWEALRARRLAGLKFRRQVPLGDGVAQFYCPAARLAVEVEDGPPDPFRDRARAARDIRTLRIAPAAVEVDLAGVLALIERTAG
ncbi:endonuclease domain-containing protein [Oceaniglobus roseus]|uniref:endonuclease domain-containing protein n=1 Tax=Oceaniglobus roseus TaxID=1737570 RepID=UPI000C7EE25D|nr:DUF559 domain-containing protein [Kandeliimicrobium roseum]